MSFIGGTPAGFFLNTAGNLLITTNTITNLDVGAQSLAAQALLEVDLQSVSLSGNLQVSAQTINFTKGDAVVAASASLYSVNSLAFAQTGVPYTGSVTVNPGAPVGQPYAGDVYITGPNWGEYGYAPGDTISISGANISATLPVVAIVGDNLYTIPIPVITSSTNYSGTSVQCTNFTPQLQAGSMTLDVTGAGSTISGAISSPGGSPAPVQLSANTAGGNITLQDIPPALISFGLELGNLNAGAGTIQLAVNGPILPLPSSGTNLTASAVDLISTGLIGNIGFPAAPITTQSGAPGQSLRLTATTNDGPVYIQDSSPAGLTINSIVADQGGQPATVHNGQVLYNSTPNSTTGSTYIAGSNNVSITSSGPIVLNSVSATGDINITGQYILQGKAQSPIVIAQNVTLQATGQGDYKGPVTFAQAPGGDTLTLPSTGFLASQYYFQAGEQIVISGATASADNGVFTIASVSGQVITLTQSYVLAPETDAVVSVGNGMIGQASAPVSLSDVTVFSAVTSNGSIYLAAGGAVDSTAEFVYAGNTTMANLEGLTNDASVTSDASFLTIETIQATGEAAAAANNGALIEYNGGTVMVNGNKQPVMVPGIIIGQTVSLTSPYNIGTAFSPFMTDASSGLDVDATATTPSSAGIDVVNNGALATIGVSTYDGNVTIVGGGSNLLTFNNNVLSELGSAVVTLTNTDGDNGSAGDVVVNGTVFVGGIVAGIDANGTAGAGQILTNASGVINGDGADVILSAASGIGTTGSPLDITNVARLAATTNTGDILVTGTGPTSTLTLSASTSTGNIDVTWNGTIDLQSEASGTPGVVLDSIAAPGTVTLDAVGGAIVEEYNSLVSANTLVLTATGAIGTASSPLEATSRGRVALTATAGNGLFLDSNTPLTVDAATAGIGKLSLSAAGNLTLAGNVSGENPALTVTAGTLTTTAGILTATAGTLLTITAAQIGATNGVLQTSALTINATATSGGIYLSNNDSGSPLTLTAAAVGTASGPTANNIEIYNAGLIVLQQQTTALTQLATGLPVAVFSPGGALTLVAGATLSPGGTPSGAGGLTITSATPSALAISTLDPYGEVANVSVAFAGSGYKTAPKVTFSGGGGFGAAATATINAQGQVTGITITNPGSGYTSAPTVTISPPGDDVYTGTYDLNGTTAVSSSSPAYLQSLVIISGTSEVSRNGQQGVAPALITFADLTSLALQTGGNGTVPVVNGTETVATTGGGITTVTITAAAITIDALGLYGNGGTALIPNGWSLDLDATNGSIVFLNMGDTIKTTGTGAITVTAGTSVTDVAALGNLTTGGGNITISAGGNIAIGTLDALTGTIVVTSANGVILFNNAAAPNLTASSTRLIEATQPVSSAQSAALAQLYATEVIAAADAASAQAAATAAAAGAQAAAELVTVNSLQAALTSIQAAVTTANQTYQTDVQITNQENNIVNADQAPVNALTAEVSTATKVATYVDLSHAILDVVNAIIKLAVAPTKAIPFVGVTADVLSSYLDLIGAILGLTSASANVAVFELQNQLDAASTTLANDSGVLAQDQVNQAQAAAQLQADMDTQTALAAALDVAQQAYTASEQTYVNDQTYSAQIQAQGDAAQAIAIADVVFAAPPQPINATGLGNGPVTITAMSPLTVGNITTSNAIYLNSAPDDPATEIDTLTVPSGVTVQSTGSLVSFVAGNNVIIQSGAAIQAADPITITANENNDPNGATVTVAGTLTAPSATIGVPANSTGPLTLNITPSSTPISVDASPAGTTTLNIDTQGLPVTITNDTITVGNSAPVTIHNVQAVHLTNETGTLTVDGTSGVANTMSLVGSGPGAGTATLDGVAFSFGGVYGGGLTGLNYQGGSGDSIAVTPPTTGSWNMNVAVAGGTGAPATLTYNAPGPNSNVTATGKNVGNVTNPTGGTLNFSNVNQVTVAYQGTQDVLALPYLSVSDAGGVYNGHQFSATTEVNGAASLDGITPTITYYSGTNVVPANQLSSAPFNAGTYTVVAAFAGNTTYSNALVSTTFTVAPANATVVVAPYTVTYDGQPHTATVTSITGVNGETGATVGTVDLSNTTHTTAGVYSDSWTFTGPNYNSITNSPITDVINKANATVVVTPYYVTFDGQPHTATYTITGVNGETGAVVGTVDVSKTTHTAAGVYSDSWTFTGTVNYNNTDIIPITDFINQPMPAPAGWLIAVYEHLLNRPADPQGLAAWTGVLNSLGNTASGRSQVVADIEQSQEYLSDVVTALYQHYLNRAPDSGGLNYWVGQLQHAETIEQVIQGFISSPEFYQVQGGGTNAGFVTVFYRDVLNRAPDPGGYAHWLNALNADAITPAQLAEAFLTSTEYRTNLLADPSQPNYNPVTNWGGYYPEFLRRPADSGGITYWLQQFAAGMSDQAVLAAIFGSNEGYAKWS